MPLGVSRREVLQVGFSGLLGVSATARADAARRPAKQVLLVFLTGAASQLETFDPKPDAPADLRGEFGSVPTPVAGLRFCEHLPKLAARAGKCAVVRTFSHADNNHTAATHHLITGAVQPGVRFDKPLSRDDWPCYAAGLAYLNPPASGVPAGVTLPHFLFEPGAALTWPGQHAGFLGAKFDPLQIDKDPNRPDFAVENLSLPPGLTATRLRDRLSLLADLNAQQESLARTADGKRLTDQQKQAADLLTSGAVGRAFDLKHETDATRDRYGRHLFGQSLLLAKRLLKAGVPVVQANMGRVQNWDSHDNIFPTCKSRLLPPLDAGVSALLDDLSAEGLLDRVFVCVIGEFGRTPRISRQNPKAAAPGRDHWAACFSGLFFGGGVRGGQVIGKSDATAAYPTTAPHRPDDLGATVYHLLGVDPSAEVRDQLNRPVQISRGRVMTELFTG
jgi:hypothetical protein